MNVLRGDTDDGDEVTEETRMLVAGLRERAASAPSAEMLADLLSAPRERTGLTREEIRQLGRDAISQAQQLAFQLGRLAVLMGDEGEP